MSSASETPDELARRVVGELTEKIDSQVVDAAPVDWAQVAAWGQAVMQAAQEAQR